MIKHHITKYNLMLGFHGILFRVFSWLVVQSSNAALNPSNLCTFAESKVLFGNSVTITITHLDHGGREGTEPAPELKRVLILASNKEAGCLLPEAKEVDYRFVSRKQELLPPKKV